ncbi:hypothetical protein EYF80_046682 [Liparis tanakae]|uniref:Uncharacterized protein n=1 Tax=Liparis tanakae TaxID=230148 RepID=A0A4Z2FQH0_9TELE|nr:hypothetical protein EYF80_046682 [Liparis tanakae]
MFLWGGGAEGRDDGACSLHITPSGQEARQSRQKRRIPGLQRFFIIIITTIIIIASPLPPEPADARPYERLRVASHVIPTSSPSLSLPCQHGGFHGIPGCSKRTENTSLQALTPGQAQGTVTAPRLPGRSRSLRRLAPSCTGSRCSSSPPPPPRCSCLWS